MSVRIDQINELIKNEVSASLLLHLTNPDLGLITVTEAETSPDLKHSTVWITVLDDNVSNQAVMKAIKKIIHTIQHELNQKLSLRYVPKLRFQIDHSAKHVNKVNQLLDQIKKEQKK